MEQFNMFMNNPDIDLCLKVYNIPETEFMRKITEVTLPKIKVHQVVYLPMMDEILTIENLKETAENYQTYVKNKEEGVDMRKTIEETKKRNNEEKKRIIHSINESRSGENSIGIHLLKKHYIEEMG